jgi:hypothetical protein
MPGTIRGMVELPFSDLDHFSEHASWGAAIWAIHMGPTHSHGTQSWQGLGWGEGRHEEVDYLVQNP